MADCNGNYKDAGSHLTLKVQNENSVSSNKAISYYERQITNNKLTTVNGHNISYTYTGEWIGNGKTLTSADRIQIKGSDYTKDTTVEFKAQYTPKTKYSFSGVYLDNIGKIMIMKMKM